MAPISLPDEPICDNDAPAPRIIRIFGHSIPGFVLVVIITVLCAVMPRLTAHIPRPGDPGHAPVASRTAESWMHSLSGR